jgi:hypothetical protein
LKKNKKAEVVMQTSKRIMLTMRLLLEGLFIAD